jgi:hypothetical protein
VNACMLLSEMADADDCGAKHSKMKWSVVSGQWSADGGVCVG